MPETATPIIRIPLEEVESSNLHSIGYDPARKIAAVRFRSGAIYHYANVDQETMTQFYTAPSRGNFFARQIKGKFPGMKVTGTCRNCGSQHGYLGTVCEECGTSVYEDVRKSSGEKIE